LKSRSNPADQPRPHSITRMRAQFTMLSTLQSIGESVAGEQDKMVPLHRQVNGTQSSAAVVVLEANDVILAGVAAQLHLNDDQFFVVDVGDPVLRALGNFN